jgi:broad specificity phosphatase PhoE
MASFYVVRHCKAGSRSHWTGDDRQRPLSKKGQKQAEDLVSLLGKFKIAAIFSSPYLRCVQTIEPLARELELQVAAAPELAEGRGLRGLYRFFDDPKLDGVALCTHGDLMWELLEDLTNRRVVPAIREQFDKGSTWAVEIEDGAPVRARYIPAP